MDTTVCRTEPLPVESEVGFYDRAQLDTLVTALQQALAGAVRLSEGFEKNTATAQDIFRGACSRGAGCGCDDELPAAQGVVGQHDDYWNSCVRAL